MTARQIAKLVKAGMEFRFEKDGVVFSSRPNAYPTLKVPMAVYDRMGTFEDLWPGDVVVTVGLPPVTYTFVAYGEDEFHVNFKRAWQCFQMAVR